MKRREALALVATLSVPLAGCSGDGGDGGENETDGGTEPTQNTTDVDGNSSDVAEGPDGNESDSDGQDGDGDEPTEEELAQEDVDAAQSALSDAVSELESQGDGDPPVTAGVSGLSAGPVRDELSSVQSAIDDAREHETTGDQDDVLDAIESTKDWMHSVLDAYQPLRDLFIEANYAIQDYVADADPDLQAVRRAADQAQSSVDVATDPYETPDSTGVVDAITTDGVEAQADRLGADLESGRSVADIIEDLREADDLWEQGLAHMNEADYGDSATYNDAADDYGAGKETFGSVSTGSLSSSYGAASDYFGCYSGEMRSACERGETAALYFASEDNAEARQIYEEAEAHRSNAQNCTLDWSA